jgi:hypothetical protein
VAHLSWLRWLISGGIGLALSSGVVASAADTTPRLEIVYGERTELDFAGVLRAVAAESALVEIDIVQGKLFVTGRKGGSTLLYIWTADGVRPQALTVRAPVRPNAQSRPQLPTLSRSQTQLSGTYALTLHQPLAGSRQPGRLNHNWMAEYPLDTQQRLSARISQLSQYSLTPEIQSMSVPLLQMAYQSPSLLANLGDTALTQNLQMLTPGFSNNLRGGNLTYSTPVSRYDVFAGNKSLPWILYRSQPTNTSEQPFLAGAAGSWLWPESASDSGRLRFQSVLMSQLTPTLSPLLASSVEWTNKEAARLQLALGTSLSSAGLFARGFYQWAWPEQRNTLNLNGQYRHLGQGYTALESPQQDLLTLQMNAQLGAEWGLSGSAWLTAVAGGFESYQVSTRISRQFRPESLTLYGQANSNRSRSGVQQYQANVGLRWIKDLPGNSSYFWQMTQSEGLGARHLHRLQLQLRLFQSPQWQLWANGHSELQDLGISAQASWNQFVFMTLNRVLSPELLWSSSLGYQLRSPFENPRWQHSIRADTGLTWFPNPLQQSQLLFNYQLQSQGIEPHIVGVLANYTWRFGYESRTSPQIQGRVFQDLNANGVYEEGEPGLGDVAIEVEGQQTYTQPDGTYTLPGGQQGSVWVRLNPDSLPPGFQVSGASTVDLTYRGAAPEAVNFPVRSQIMIEGYAFASPLLARGLERVQVQLDGQHPLNTDSSGRFYTLTTPGAHELRINPALIPEGYRLQGPLTRRFESLENVRLDFIFEPLIYVELSCFDRPGGLALTGLQVGIAGSDSWEVSDAEGKVLLAVPAGNVTLHFPSLGKSMSLATGDVPTTLRRRIYLSSLSAS